MNNRNCTNNLVEHYCHEIKYLKEYLSLKHRISDKEFIELIKHILSKVSIKEVNKFFNSRLEKKDIIKVHRFIYGEKEISLLDFDLFKEILKNKNNNLDHEQICKEVLKYEGKAKKEFFRQFYITDLLSTRSLNELNIFIREKYFPRFFLKKLNNIFTSSNIKSSFKLVNIKIKDKYMDLLAKVLNKDRYYIRLDYPLVDVHSFENFELISRVNYDFLEIEYL
jgi:hypothetical protein